MKLLALFFLITALILEATFTTVPLIFVVLLVFTVTLKQNWIFAPAFIFGLIFDLVSFKTPGLSSIFLVTFLFLVLSYRRKFEIATNYFVLTSSFIGSLGFLAVLGYNNNIFFQAVAGSIFGLILFNLLQRANLKN